MPRSASCMAAMRLLPEPIDVVVSAGCLARKRSDGRRGVPRWRGTQFGWRSQDQEIEVRELIGRYVFYEHLAFSGEIQFRAALYLADVVEELRNAGEQLHRQRDRINSVLEVNDGVLTARLIEIESINTRAALELVLSGPANQCVTPL